MREMCEYGDGRRRALRARRLRLCARLLPPRPPARSVGVHLLRDTRRGRAAAAAFEKSPYEAGLIAHVVVQKCACSVPIYRLENSSSGSAYPWLAAR
jgi:hypothetical protein